LRYHKAAPKAHRRAKPQILEPEPVMTVESTMLAVLVVLTLCLIVLAIAAIFVVNNLRAIHAEQRSLQRLTRQMDWTTILVNTQQHTKESVRILDVIDKRLQKLEALEKLQISQFDVGRSLRVPPTAR
jgi:hypothetical protein